MRRGPKFKKFGETVAAAIVSSLLLDCSLAVDRRDANGCSFETDNNNWFDWATNWANKLRLYPKATIKFDQTVSSIKGKSKTNGRSIQALEIFLENHYIKTKKKIKLIEEKEGPGIFWNFGKMLQLQQLVTTWWTPDFWLNFFPVQDRLNKSWNLLDVCIPRLANLSI